MSSSIKELSLAFFKGLAFGKGLIMGRELAENKDMAEDRWITIHPFGNMKQGEADTGEGKRYYQRIFINDETDEIEGGLGGKLNGTKISDMGENLRALRENKPLKMSDGQSGKTDKKETKKPEQIKSNSDTEKKNQELLEKIEEEQVAKSQYPNSAKETAKKYKDKVLTLLNNPNIDEDSKKCIIKSYATSVWRGSEYTVSDTLKQIDNRDKFPEREQVLTNLKSEIKDVLQEYEDKLNAIDIKDRRKSSYLNKIKTIREALDKAPFSYFGSGIPVCAGNVEDFISHVKSYKDVFSDTKRLADKWLRENEYMNYKVSEEDLERSKEKAEEREERIDRMRERADQIKKAGYAKAHEGFSELDEIPFGQPNIIGRRDIYKRPNSKIDSGFREVKRGEDLERRAVGAESVLGNMRLDDPAIIPKLQEAVKNADTSAKRQYYRDKLDTAIRTLERSKGDGLSKETKLYTLKEDFEDGRIRFRFDGKPRQEIIDIMKSRGFRWSPSNKAWQRQNTPNGVWSAKKVMEELKQFE